VRYSVLRQGDRTAMKTFLQTFPVDCPDRLGRTPLMYASIGNRGKALEFLLRQGAIATTQDANGRTALLWAAYYGHAEIVRTLIRHDRGLVDLPDPDGRTALHWATKHESTKCLDLLLRAMVAETVNAQDQEQVTALHWAVLCQHPEHTSHLLKVTPA
jgi:ankyrin repeat protein